MMKIEENGCECTKPEIKKKYPEGCSLNQVIKCHGEQSVSELLKHVKIEKED